VFRIPRIYGYLNRVQSSRRLERESGRNVELMWLTGRLVPDHKTIADFRKDNGPSIRKVCVQFVALCRQMGLLTKANVAIDGPARRWSAAWRRSIRVWRGI
jgi:transposase